MRKIVSSLISLFTVVGGHIFNRRLDLGLLFFALLLFAIYAAWIGAPMLLFNKGHIDISTDNSPFEWLGYTLIAATGLVVLISTIVSFVTAKSHSLRPPVGKAGILSGTLASILGMMTILWVVTTGLSYISFDNFPEGSINIKSNSDEEDSPRFKRSYFFHKTVRYGGKWLDSRQLKSLPKGSSNISGRISYKGAPAKGVRLFAILNESYKSENVFTDKNGVFTISLPEGEWLLNRITLEQWPDHPDDTPVLVFGGSDGPLLEKMYHAGPDFRSEGLSINASKTPAPMEQIDLVIRPKIELLWPKAEAQTANHEQNKISWEGVAEASKYQLQLHRMEKDGSSTSYYPSAWINTDKTEVPLKEFSIIPDEPDTKTEYLVKIYAFNKDGELITSSGEFSSRRSLVLTGNIISDTSDVLSLSRTSDLTGDERIKELKIMRRDRERLKAADTLAKEGLIDAAKTIAGRVKSKSLEAEKLRTMGLILASEGNCKGAEVKFLEANKKRGENCFPQLYRERCGRAK